jgi:hypothetical protein
VPTDYPELSKIFLGTELTLDPLAAMALADQEQVMALLDTVRTDSQAVAALLERVTSTRPKESPFQITLRQQQPIVTGMPHQPCAGFHKPLF